MRIHYYNIIEHIMPIIDKEALLIKAKSPWLIHFDNINEEE